MINQEIYIVGGGASLRHFDWLRLDDKTVLAINDAAFRLPYATHVYFADKYWFDHWQHKVSEHAGQIHQGVSDDAESVQLGWVRRWNFSEHFSMEPDEVIAGCSGNAAINLVVQLGYKKLHLLGLDFSHLGNFHEDNLRAGSHRPILWRRRFDEMLPALKACGVEILSGAPHG